MESMNEMKTHVETLLAAEMASHQSPSLTVYVRAHDAAKAAEGDTSYQRREPRMYQSLGRTQKVHTGQEGSSNKGSDDRAGEHGFEKRSNECGCSECGKDGLGR